MSERDTAAELVQAWGEWADAGCHVHPCKADGSKNPVSVEGGSGEIDDQGKHGWGYGRIRDGDLPAVTLDQFAEMVKAGKADGFGVFCGPPSGGLEMLEVEGRARGLLSKVKQHAAQFGHHADELLARVAGGCVQRSPSGGVHFLYRVDGGARGNVKLARRPDPEIDGGDQVLAETRGTGGWFVAAPSGGRTHKSGKAYKIERGSPATIPTITAAERDTLYALFRMLDEIPPEPTPEERPRVERKAGDPLRPGDDYNERATWEEILAGWKKGKRVGDRQHWTRPGKGKGTSATTTDTVLCCFSSSAGLPVFDSAAGANALSKFATFAHQRHRGDYAAAAADLRAAGYGDTRDTTPPPHADQEPPVPGQRLVLVRASDIPCTPINWLWPQRIVGDGLTIITGPVGVSKSLISVDVAARVTTGNKWPDGTGSATQGTVILFGAEDDAGKVVVPRLKAAGADLDRVLVCQGTIGDGDESEPENVILERHIDQLRTALDTVTDCRLIVFDPLPDYLSADENSSREVRAALMPLARLAQERNVAVVAVLHQNKKTDLTTVQRIAGSGAFVQIARIVLAIGLHPEDMEAADGEKRRVMLVSKSNYGQRDVGQAYAIETKSSGAPGIVWHAGEITIDADSLSRRPTGGGQHEDRRSEAVDSLRELLEVGEKNAGAIAEEMQDRGLGRRQIAHAAEALNVVKRKHRDGWYWRLPKGDGRQVVSSGARAAAAAGGAARYTEFDTWSGEAQAAEIARP